MRFVDSSPADSDARELLEQYFIERTAGFVGGGYRVAPPDPALFVSPAGAFLVLTDDDGTALGCGGIRRLPDEDGTTRYEIKHLYLRPEARGTGGGRALLTELETRAVQLGAQRLVLDTNASLVAAGALYRRSGYVETAPYNDNPNATHWFAKDVSAPSNRASESSD